MEICWPSGKMKWGRFMFTSHCMFPQGVCSLEKLSRLARKKKYNKDV